MPAPRVLCYADFEATSRAAAQQVVNAARDHAAASSRPFHLALSGGSTPRRMMELLATSHRDEIAWDLVELWWCDERAVPPDHPDSNFGVAQRILLAPLDLSAERAHRLRGELPSPNEAAAELQRELIAALGEPPSLDLALLGLGSDGHTASLFPSSPAVELAIARRAPDAPPTTAEPAVAEPAPAPPWVVANPVTSPLVAGGAATRLTLTFAALHAAHRLVVVITGADKAAALREVLCGAFDPMRYPAQLLAASPRPVLWLVDEAAASHLPADWLARHS